MTSPGGVNNSNNRILENEIADNHWGILVTGGVNAGNLIAYNNIRGNQRAGIALMVTPTGNLILENNSTGNGLANLAPTMRFDLFDAFLAGANVWLSNKGTANFPVSPTGIGPQWGEWSNLQGKDYPKVVVATGELPFCLRAEHEKR